MPGVEKATETNSFKSQLNEFFKAGDRGENTNCS